MTLLICRLPKEGRPTAQEARAAGITAWLVPAQLSAQHSLELDGAIAWLEAEGNTLPFCLEWHLPEALTPAQEAQAAALLRPLLAHANALLWQGRTPLWIANPEQLSQLHFSRRRLQVQLGPHCALWGGGPLGEGLDARYDRPSQDVACQVINGEQANYESFLFHAHRLKASPQLRVPAVLALANERAGVYANARAEHYNEWLGQVSAWADLRQPPGQHGLVLVDDWHGHRRWYRPGPQPVPSSHATPTPAVSERWGTPAQQNPAVVVHGFHLDLLPALLQGLGQGEEPALDLYLSTPREQSEQAAAVVRQLGWQRAEIVGVENRGRDVAPFLQELLPRVLANGHPWLLKLHTKRSEHLSDGASWRQHLRAQLASSQACEQLSELFAADPDLGLIAPGGSLLPTSISLCENGRHLRELLEALEIESRWWLEQHFVAGTMFAARTAALSPLASQQPAPKAYESEQGQLDGTLAHALERLIAAVVLQAGYRLEELPADGAKVPGFGYGHAAITRPND
jgi:hypothetical protein